MPVNSTGCGPYATRHGPGSAPRRDRHPWMNFKEVVWLVVLHLGLPFVSIEHRLGGQLALVQFVRREDKTALLVDKRLAVREPRRQGSCDMVDDLVGLG